ncbi:MAG: hypothetical protein ABIA93_02075 [Candidatus Woesearchaeota archaeon]
MKPIIWVWLLFAGVLALHLLVAFGTPFLNYDGYETIRNVESIRATGLPLFHDSLSFQGRYSIFSPIFYYLLAGISFFMPVIMAAKIVPNVLIALSVFLAYGIGRRITASSGAGLLIAALVGFLPIGFISLSNTASAYTLLFPLMLLFYYFMLNIHRKKYSIYALITAVLVTAMHSFAAVFILGLLVYVLLTRIQESESRRKTEDIVIFLVLFALWFYLIIYKQAFRVEGLSILRQSIPSPLLAQWFSDFSFVESVYMIGFIPLVLGVYGAYHALLEEREPLMYIFIANIIVTGVLLWLKLVRLNVGLLFLGINLCILAGYAARLGYIYLPKTKVAMLRPYLLAFVLLLVVASAIAGISLYRYDTPNQNDVTALSFADAALPANATIVAFPKEGYFIEYTANRKTLLDRNFLLAPQTTERYNAMRIIFTSPFQIPALRALQEFGADYIYLSEETQKSLNITGLAYADKSCFSLIYNNHGKLYRKECALEG